MNTGKWGWLGRGERDEEEKEKQIYERSQTISLRLAPGVKKQQSGEGLGKRLLFKTI